jgi:hypothetical protein
VFLLKKRFKKITIDNQIFVWNYTNKYDVASDTYISRLFFSYQDKKNLRVECFFRDSGHPYLGSRLNVGFLATKNGEEYKINFNRPGFIAEFIRFVLAHKVDFGKRERYRFDNACSFLSEMGYENFRCAYCTPETDEKHRVLSIT